jgi:hypothetical protein
MLPAEIANRLPEELTGEQLEKTAALRGLLTMCGGILEFEGQRVAVKNGTFDISQPMAIKHGDETLFMRVYRSTTATTAATYGFKLSPTADDAPNYDDYSDIRFERGTDGSYELVMGGAGSEPLINDLESIKFLKDVVAKKSRALVQQAINKEQARERKFQTIKKRVLKIGAITVAGAVVTTGVVRGVSLLTSPHSAVEGAKEIAVGQQLAPNFVQGWIGDYDANEFTRVKFEQRPSGSTSSICKTINTQLADTSVVHAITDFHTYDFPQNPDGVNRSLEEEFTINVDSDAVKVCWAPTSAALGPFEKYYTDTPTVGIYVENTKK